MARVARKGTADRKGDCRPKKRGKRQIIIIIIIIIVIEKGGKKRRKGLSDGWGRRARVRGGCARRQKVRLCVLCLVAKQKNSYERTCRPASKKKNQSRWSNIFLFFFWRPWKAARKRAGEEKSLKKKRKGASVFCRAFFLSGRRRRRRSALAPDLQAMTQLFFCHLARFSFVPSSSSSFFGRDGERGSSPARLLRRPLVSGIDLPREVKGRRRSA